MKKTFLIYLLLSFVMAGYTQTVGELSVSVSTSDTGGNYKPRNVMAIWVENSDGDFIKTLLAYADKRKGYLTHWKNVTTNAGTAYNKVDAVSGATKSSHGTRTCTWDGTNFSGDTVDDGTYTLCLELTDKNSTGNYSTFEFLKSTDSVSYTPGNEASFNNIQLNWVPVVKTSVDLLDENVYKVYPTPTTGQLLVIGENVETIEINDSNGKTIQKSTSTNLDLSSYPNGVYFINIITNQGSIVKRVLKE